MTLDQLKRKLTKYGELKVCKQGIVFTVLIIGTGLTKQKTVMAIQEDVLSCAGKYSFVEAMNNDETYFLMILKPAQ